MERRSGPDLHNVAARERFAEEARGVSHKDFCSWMSFLFKQLAVPIVSKL
jgi:hypothetical protein